MKLMTSLYLSFQRKTSSSQLKIWKLTICQRKTEIIASKYYATLAVRLFYTEQLQRQQPQHLLPYSYFRTADVGLTSHRNQLQKGMPRKAVSFSSQWAPLAQRPGSIQKVSCDISAEKYCFPWTSKESRFVHQKLESTFYRVQHFKQKVVGQIFCKKEEKSTDPA